MIVAFTGAGISKYSGIPTFEDKPELRDILSREYKERFPQSFRQCISNLKEVCSKSTPNCAHFTLAQFKIPTITMNVDGLHEKALKEYLHNTDSLLEIHGNIFKNNLVLYGDSAPKYSEALGWIRRLRSGDILLVVGTSYYTPISISIKHLAQRIGVTVIEINEDSEVKVPQFIEQHLSDIGSIMELYTREELY